jgi:hypothetical protein
MALDRDLEAAMGKTLTDDQKKAIADADKAMHEAVKAAHDAFIQKVADVTGLTVDKVLAAIQPPPPPDGKGPPPPPPGEGHKGPPPPPPGQAPPAGSPSGT